MVAANIEGMFADLRHCNAVSKQTHLRQNHTLASRHRLLQAIGVIGLDPDNFHFRTYIFNISRHTGKHTAAAAGHKHCMQRALVLTQNLHRYRALPSNHIRVVVRMDINKTFFFHEFQRMR